MICRWNHQISSHIMTPFMHICHAPHFVDATLNLDQELAKKVFPPVLLVLADTHRNTNNLHIMNILYINYILKIGIYIYKATTSHICIYIYLYLYLSPLQTKKALPRCVDSFVCLNSFVFVSKLEILPRDLKNHSTALIGRQSLWKVWSFNVEDRGRNFLLHLETRKDADDHHPHVLEHLPVSYAGMPCKITFPVNLLRNSSSLCLSWRNW